LVYWAKAPVPRLKVFGEDERGRTCTPNAFEQGVRMAGYVFDSGTPLSRLTLQPIERRAGCRLDAIAVLKR